jgi:hypothetical protein
MFAMARSRKRGLSQSESRDQCSASEPECIAKKGTQRGDQLFDEGSGEVGRSKESVSLFIHMPLARLRIFGDGLIELQLDGVRSTLFKSIKFQLLASEESFITFRPVFQFIF